MNALVVIHSINILTLSACNVMGAMAILNIYPSQSKVVFFNFFIIFFIFQVDKVDFFFSFK